jgi:chloramphenicol 3-O-phosphotransferase
MLSNPAHPAPVSFLPGAHADRETAAGWKQWRLTRGSFVPAPRLTLAQYRLMSPRDKAVHDLHRAATHANLPMQETPMSEAVAKLMRSRIQSNALKHNPTTLAGLMINGGGYQGKTATACEAAAAFEEFWLDLHHGLNPDAVPGTRDLLAHVAYVQTPVTAKPKSTCAAILDFFGMDSKNMDLPQMVRSVRKALYAHGTKVLILDDITRLKMHREADQDVLDLLRSFMSMNITLVLIGVGIPKSGLLREGRLDPRTNQVVFSAGKSKSYNDEAATQTERRFDLIDLNPFRYDTPQAIDAWLDHLAGIEDQVRLFDAPDGMLTTGTMPEYLFRRTRGIVGLLERLIEDGCTQAIDSKEERITTELLEGIAIDLGNPADRLGDAGEIPAVPQRPAKTTKKAASKRPRNTVFDDRGLPGTAAG